MHQATLPSLLEAVKKQLPASRKSALQDRGSRLAAAHQQTLQNARESATYAWDASPDQHRSPLRGTLGANQDEDWSLVSTMQFVSRWPMKLWNFDKYYQFIGGSGGYGSGYGAPSAVGAALANRKHGRLSVNIQCDGDLM